MYSRGKVVLSWLLTCLLSGLLGCGQTATGPETYAGPAPEFSANLAPGATVSWSGNFNGTAIPRNRVIWFTGVLGYSGPTLFPVTLHLQQSSIGFTANGVLYNIPAPNGTVVLSPTATSASTHYDPVSKSWLTVAPFSASGVVLFSAVPWTVPVDLPGGIKPVTWTGQFTTDTPGTSIKWKWSAAVYATMSDNPEDLGVKAVDGSALTIYRNSDHAGTPEDFKTYVVGGAMGGGGSNYTGGRTGDLVVVPAPCESGALNGFAKIKGDRGGSLTVGRFTVQVPPGAYSGDATVRIDIPDQGVLQCNLHIDPVSANSFTVPVVLTTSYDGADVANPNTLIEVWFDEAAGVWRQVPGSTVDATNRVVTAPLAHFSTYGVARGGKAGW